jgi:hypothetical protein
MKGTKLSLVKFLLAEGGLRIGVPGGMGICEVA